MDARAVRASLVSAITLLFWGCSTTGGGIAPHEGFQLTFLDRLWNVRVRYSDDGTHWHSAETAWGTSDGGVGATASLDAAGTSRLIAYPTTFGNLRLLDGIGADNWASQFDISEFDFLNEILSMSRPSIVNLGDNHFLIAFIRAGNPRRPSVLRLDRSHGTVVDDTPSELLAAGDLVEAPSLSYLPPNASQGRSDATVILAWRTPQEAGVQREIVAQFGSVTATGDVLWGGTRSLTPEQTAGAVRSEPSVTNDGTRFLLAVIREAEGFLPEYVASGANLFVYESSDGLSWNSIVGVPVLGLESVIDYNAHVEFAILTSCIGVVAVVPYPDGEPQMFRWTYTEPQSAGDFIYTFERIDGAFGSHLPFPSSQFSLIRTGNAGDGYRTCF